MECVPNINIISNTLNVISFSGILNLRLRSIKWVFGVRNPTYHITFEHVQIFNLES